MGRFVSGPRVREREGEGLGGRGIGRERDWEGEGLGGRGIRREMGWVGEGGKEGVDEHTEWEGERARSE